MIIVHILLWKLENILTDWKAWSDQLVKKKKKRGKKTSDPFPQCLSKNTERQAYHRQMFPTFVQIMVINIEVSHFYEAHIKSRLKQSGKSVKGTCFPTILYTKQSNKLVCFASTSCCQSKFFWGRGGGGDKNWGTERGVCYANLLMHTWLTRTNTDTSLAAETLVTLETSAENSLF